MTTLREFTTVQCPFDQVPERLYAHFDGGDAVLPLHVRIGDLKLERDVEFHLETKPGYPGYKLLDVSWSPKDGGPYPTFAGTLSVAEDAIGWSRIEIDGRYSRRSASPASPSTLRSVTASRKAPRSSCWPSSSASCRRRR